MVNASVGSLAMVWFRKKKKAKSISVPSISFVGEQDGVPEQELKNNYLQLLQERQHVQSAYLARVTYGDSDAINVALCIRMECETDDALRKDLGNLFTATFNQKEHLDIAFIRDDQEEELKLVCQPFYEKKCQHGA